MVRWTNPSIFISPNPEDPIQGVLFFGIIKEQGGYRMEEKKKLLLIEDDEHILELLKYNLETRHYEICIARDGDEGIRLARAEKPDLIILDLMLPKVDGLDVCRVIRKDDQVADTPIIMLTAKGSEMDKITGLELGADDYITKPFSIRELMTRIKVVLRR